MFCSSHDFPGFSIFHRCNLLSQPSTIPPTPNHKRGKDKEKLSSTKNNDEVDEEEPELRSLQQQAAAITTGMISVAVGLACAENFLYVFFLGGTSGTSVSQEFAVLLFRPVFPVHALAAVMQSINMIRKFIEEKTIKERNVGVGRGCQLLC
jgi:hypothetical protein